MVNQGYYSTGGDKTTRVSTAKCRKGHKCANGVEKPCGGGEYQDEEGQPICKPCAGGVAFNINTGLYCKVGSNCVDVVATIIVVVLCLYV